LNFFENIERHKYSILGTIGIHVLLLVWLNLQLVVNAPNFSNERIVLRLDFSKNEENIEKQLQETENNGGENNTPLTSVVANANQEKTTYSNQNFSKSQADQEVLEELKQLENEEFNSIKHIEKKEKNLEEAPKIDNNLIKEGAESNEKASYGNDVKATASYYLPNRTPQRKPAPSYKCTTEGIVTVKIKVNQKGRIVSAIIDESKTNTQNECLRHEAINYVKRWRFTQNFDDKLKKEGWIKFVYVSQ